MTGKATALATANIAFIKYWGTRDVSQTLPYNPSYSMTLAHCASRTTIECLDDGSRDRVYLQRENGELEPAPESFAGGVSAHLDRIRQWAGCEWSFKVATVNSFPTGAGIAPSASGFCALALGAVAALGREVSAAELSVLARLSGSGSAARSAMGGYVEWPAGDDPDMGHAVQVETADHWHLRDLVAVLDRRTKKVSSLDGHRLAPTSPYFEPRQELLPERLEHVRAAVHERDFARLATVIEEEAIDLHMIAMTSRPPIYYWLPGTLQVMEQVRRLRADGVEACFTMDAGANVHVICTRDAEERVAAVLDRIPDVQMVLRDGVGSGPHLSEDHLF